MFDMFPVWDIHGFDQLMEDIFPEIKSHQKVESTKGRPVNRGYLKDEHGNITNIILETIYTPFKKDDVNLSVCDDILTISIGKNSESNNLTTGDIAYDYKTISKKSVELKFKLVGDINKDAIDAKATDGVLTIDLPIKEEEIPVVKEIKLA